MSAALVFVAGALVTMRMRAGARRTQAYLSFTYGRGADYAGVWVVAGCVVDSWPRTVVLDHTSEVSALPGMKAMARYSTFTPPASSLGSWQR